MTEYTHVLIPVAETEVATENNNNKNGTKNGYILDVFRPKQTYALPSKHLRPPDNVKIIAIRQKNIQRKAEEGSHRNANTGQDVAFFDDKSEFRLLR